MDKQYFVAAADEVAAGQVDAALLVKSLALADGDEKRGRALYIQLRAKELSREHRLARRSAAPKSDYDFVQRGAEMFRVMVYTVCGAIALVLVGVYFFGW